MSGQEREREWLEAVFAAHHQAVLAYALRRVPPDEADDVLSEVFASAWRHRSRVPDPPLPWLYRTASNHVLHAHRGRGRRSSLMARLMAQPTSVQADLAEGVVDRLDAESVVLSALRALPLRDAEILRLSTWEDLPLDEVAYVLNCTPAAARVRLHRARRRLAHALEHTTTRATAEEATA